jgi:hypothetical protein
VNTISCFWLPFYPAYYHIHFFGSSAAVYSTFSMHI